MQCCDLEGHPKSNEYQGNLGMISRNLFMGEQWGRYNLPMIWYYSICIAYYNMYIYICIILSYIYIYIVFYIFFPYICIYITLCIYIYITLCIYIYILLCVYIYIYYFVYVYIYIYIYILHIIVYIDIWMFPNFTPVLFLKETERCGYGNHWIDGHWCEMMAIDINIINIIYHIVYIYYILTYNIINIERWPLMAIDWIWFSIGKGSFRPPVLTSASEHQCWPKDLIIQCLPSGNLT